MTIKRTHKSHQKKWLKENSHLKILDLGNFDKSLCGYS